MKRDNLKLKKDRDFSLDLLRVLASFMVIILHVSAQNFDHVSVKSLEWNIFNIYDSMARWTVPVFVMISGSLFLSKDHSVLDMYKKYIARIVVAFVFWSAIYAVEYFFIFHCSIKEAIWQFLVGPTHLWFLFMMVGTYICVPVLKCIVASDSITKYFLVLGFVFSCVLPTGTVVCDLLYPRLGKLIEVILGNVGFHLAVGYTFYFVLGYWLSKMQISTRMQHFIYVGGKIGIIVTAILTGVCSAIWNTPRLDFYGNFMCNVMVTSCAVFLYFRNKAFTLSARLTAMIRYVSQRSFGIYLVHMLIIDLVDRACNLNTLSFNPLLSVPVISVIVFGTSLIIVNGIYRIPVLGKLVA